MGSPTCKCNEGLKYDKEQNACIGETIECTFECPDERCAWQYDFLGMPKCNCKGVSVYNKETKTCEIGNDDSFLTLEEFLILSF